MNENPVIVTIWQILKVIASTITWVALVTVKIVEGLFEQRDNKESTVTTPETEEHKVHYRDVADTVVHPEDDPDHDDHHKSHYRDVADTVVHPEDDPDHDDHHKAHYRDIADTVVHPEDDPDHDDHHKSHYRDVSDVHEDE